MGKWDARQAQLMRRLEALDAKLHEYEDALDAPRPKDDEDRATEREDDDVMEALGQKGLKEIEAIRAALKRIEDDTYGICQKCGDEILDERLDLLPFTPFCRRCAV